MGEPLKIGVIGGSGLYELEGLEKVSRVSIETPFGAPSDALLTGELAGVPMVFLPRHGVGHRILPHEINFRANLWAMKKLGVTEIVSVSAVGSMKEAIVPGHLVLVDQFIDRTKSRPSTFFGDGIVVHVPFYEPTCPNMRRGLGQVADEIGVKTHMGGTYVCIEGPTFSTRAESFLYRSWGVDVVGMTNMPEAKLAREAEICYATIALATDYDCWHETEEAVSVEAVLKTLAREVEQAKQVIAGFVKARAAHPAGPTCPLCPVAARGGMMTAAEHVSDVVRKRLEPIIGGFLPAGGE
ncbi:MAG: S-methyl-5'-thioadenosine phosphorylase [Deltaproteobacteria bacterium]|nr:S-methyl-5'-thioadenosine phosphorylase [Deltaproteobacteria bacterium]